MEKKSTEERKEEIMEATLELIGEKGIQSLRTSEISERVGFSEAALFKHFSSKEEIIQNTVKKAGERIIENISNELEKRKGEHTLEKLSKVLELHLGFIEENPGISRLLFSDETHNNQENLQKELLKIIEEYRKLIVNTLEEGKEKGHIRGDLDSETVFRLFFGVFQTQILLWSLNGNEGSIENQVDSIWDSFEKLIRK